MEEGGVRGYEPHWTSGREGAWQVSPLGRRSAGRRGTECGGPSERQPSYSDDYKLERKQEGISHHDVKLNLGNEFELALHGTADYITQT